MAETCGASHSRAFALSPITGKVVMRKRAAAKAQAATQAQAADSVGGTPQQFDAFIKSELRRWPEVVKATGIKTE